MSYENQMYNEMTGEHAPTPFNPLGDDLEQGEDLGLEEATPEATGQGIEMAQQGETLTRQRLKQEEIELYLWLQ